MYLSARLDKSVFLNALLFFIYFLVLVWVNNSYVYMLHEYMGAAVKPVSVGLIIYLAVLAPICAFLCGTRVDRPGDLVVTLLFLVVVPHALVLEAANQFAPDAMPWGGVSLGVLLGMLVIASANKFRFYESQNRQSDSLSRHCLAMLAMLNVLVLLFIFLKSASYFSFNFSEQYVRRALARDVFQAGSGAGYLASMGTQAFFPVLFAWGVYRKSRTYVLLGVANALVLWGAFGQKYPFMVLVLIYLLMQYFRRYGGVKLSWLLAGAITFLLLGAMEHEVFGYSYLNDYFVRRAFIVPSTLLGAVDNFVSLFAFNSYSDTLLSSVMGVVKSEPLTFRIGQEIFSNPKLNANVNFFAIAYLQSGYSAVVVESIFVGSVVMLLNYLYMRHGAFITIPVGLLFATKILEQSLLTVLMGSGVFLMLIFLVLVSVPFTFGKKVYER
ncbi:hypothetical protein ACF8Q9_25415 [Pseudomonas sp. TYF_15]|uniref:hypothetical protein n=2 Tax=Pseudomonas TaxID=286 RepID=UPI0003AEE28D|nr:MULTISPECIES: hypothetical protein [Pseudomonas]EKT4496643.1 hypothetical protein [Pseudomonas putida]EKT8867637.1 hypothetical protein [Pseudomonas putida]ERL01502.1 hypothetical protein O999_22265 [Pseudomonas putida LF54]MDF3175031.1 hypothetical protein [Pseudomonas sp. ER28]HDS0961786.1 hypothetical protein [Pseudomonas putida]